MPHASSAARGARALLGVPAEASPDQIVRAYRQHARRLHPDVSMDPDAAAQFLALQAAYRLAIEEARHSARHREARPIAASMLDDHCGPTVVLETSTGRSVSVLPGGDPAWLIAGPVRVQPPQPGALDSPVIPSGGQP
jgi:hypothetical protein